MDIEKSLDLVASRFHRCKRFKAFLYIFTKSIFCKWCVYFNVLDKDYHTPLHVAIPHNCEKAVEILLKNGADINLICIRDCTSLHISTMRKNMKIAELLLQKRANVHLKFYCKDGNTALIALDIVTANRCKKIVQLLLNSGAKFN